MKADLQSMILPFMILQNNMGQNDLRSHSPIAHRASTT